MEIRSAKASDVPGVLPMVAKICGLHRQWDAAKYGFKPQPEEMYRRWLTHRADDPRSVFLVAEGQGRLVAFLIGTVEAEIPIYQIEEYGFIHDLWVEEEYRNEGIGKQMTMMAVEKFAEIGVKQVRLDTAAPNDVARRLFEACGFRPSAMEMLLEIPQGSTGHG
ncbi:MAG TPA: GNAT family N-acetyltransferase [Tepidisphaeraceae bacterium]|nr:GNAT family N-acetyltransferase [Tepidisphaeraceae bacterium]